MNALTKTKQIALTAIFITLGVIIPQIFHMFAMSGRVFLPMHIPVLICGFVCGGFCGATCGVLTVILSSLMTGMPPIFPYGVAMSLELMTYGLISGILYNRLGLYPSLITAMLAGRVVSGSVNAILAGVAGKSYALTGFISGAFLVSFPGIIIQLVAIPIIINILSKNNIIKKDNNDIKT